MAYFGAKVCFTKIKTYKLLLSRCLKTFGFGRDKKRASYSIGGSFFGSVYYDFFIPNIPPKQAATKAAAPLVAILTRSMFPAFWLVNIRIRKKQIPRANPW